ncbi:hypothetical protein PAPHI01_0731 [Pancytospora philotis]|nr:hypothetical protein PAPHI01_0731 [Pancytospora philotis]
MAVFAEPGLSAFITGVRKLPVAQQKQRAAHEQKQIALREQRRSESLLLGLEKRLFLQLRGVDIAEFEFVKACASANSSVRRCGYHGLVQYERPACGILLVNTVSKQLQNRETRADALAFLCNYSGSRAGMGEIAEQIVVPQDREGTYASAIIAKSKIRPELHFHMHSQNERALLVKLQIVLDHKLHGRLSDNDVLYLKDRIFDARCGFLVLKLVQMYLVLLRSGKLAPGEKLLEHLRSLVIGPAVKSVKQIDIAIAYECCKFLCAADNFTERAEGFIFRLINSENPNSRYLGFSFSAQYGVLTELTVEKIINLGVRSGFYLETLVSLVNRGNCRRLYKQREEIMHYVLRDRIDPALASRVLCTLLTKITELADHEFLCKILYECPQVYGAVRERVLHSLEQIRPLFKIISGKEEIEYFQMIYDTLPSKTKDCALVASLATCHLRALTAGKASAEKTELLESLIDVLCIHGDLSENRKLLLAELQRMRSTGAAKELCGVILSGVVLFNAALETKYAYAGGGNWLVYSQSDDSITVEQRADAEDVSIEHDGASLQLLSRSTAADMATLVLQKPSTTGPFVLHAISKGVTRRIELFL